MSNPRPKEETEVERAERIAREDKEAQEEVKRLLRPAQVERAERIAREDKEAQEEVKRLLRPAL